jgi:hypothetical protein
MPDSVEMPAPVSATIWRERETISRASWRGSGMRFHCKENSMAEVRNRRQRQIANNPIQKRNTSPLMSPIFLIRPDHPMNR